MTDYLTVPDTAKNPNALKTFSVEDVAKVSRLDCPAFGFAEHALAAEPTGINGMGG